jgi:(1->4)-alpha-D-glucan 1-alpha-D-glucosylmutase
MVTLASPVPTELSGLSECLDRLAAGKRADRPLAAYRLQFNRGFRFEDARGLVRYLHALGVSHCYASPILKARAGSTHGYDITDHSALNPEIGTEEEFRSLIAELKAQRMGVVLDTVPNHMGTGRGDNPWWQDVLENGPASEYADFFDIDWQPLKAELQDKVLIPVLGGAYGAELEQGRLRLDYREDGSFVVRYYDNVLPIDPQTVPMIFEQAGNLATRHVEERWREVDRPELESIVAGMRSLPPHTVTDPELVATRRREIPGLKKRLAQLVERSPEVRGVITDALAKVNGHAGNPRSFDALHRLLNAQAYRLAHWRVSAEEINYRRFFDINELVGLRMENPLVFAATHKLVRRLLGEGSISGLRIDHPDGLFNPAQYFMRVQMLYAASQCVGPEAAPPLAENGIEVDVQSLVGQHDWMNQRAPLYVIVEKILEPGEDLPAAWPVDGTVGYEFTNLVNGIFIQQRNLRVFTNLYHRFIGGAVDPDTLTYGSKKLILRVALSSEVTVLSHMLEEISMTDRHARDFTRAALADAIRETIACFPVYRTYIDERGNISERDRGYIQDAVVRAKRRNESTAAAVFDFLRDVLLLRNTSTISAENYRKRLYFTLKFQQLSGPVMAKGLEDTACYIYHRFVSVNEVGGSPRLFGAGLDEFHRANQDRAAKWPYAMLATSTHDTKRSEDVRARLNVLSEMPREWAAQVMRWRRANRVKKRGLSDGRTVPDHNEEYLLYQTLAGAWPLALEGRAAEEDFIRRIQQYMDKAVHEAKVNLSWVNPNPAYSEALAEFIARVLAPGTPRRPNAFRQQLEAFLPPVMFFGVMNSLAQVVLKLTVPGVPDVYQGAELWDFSLVDPDNRRPVDFALRQRLLNDLLTRSVQDDLPALGAELLRDYRDGRLKLWTTLRALRFRRDRAELFQSGSYLPLAAPTEKPEHVVAFAREHEWQMAIVAVPRFSYTLMRGEMRPPLGEVWGSAELALPPQAPDEFVNIFTGETVRRTPGRTLLCREVFARFPVALLSSR